MTTPVRSPMVALSAVLGGPVTDPAGAEVGRVLDVVLTLPSWGYPVLSGVVVGGRDSGTVVGAEHLTAITAHGVTLSTPAPPTPGGHGVGGGGARVDGAGVGQVLLQADVLGHRVLDLACARWLRGRDAVLTRSGHQWLVVGVDVARSGWWQRLTEHPEPDVRDWAGLEVLLGHTPTAAHRLPWTRLGELRPAQLADLLESATHAEKRDLLTPDHRSRLLAARSTPNIAAVLARMNDDDAADTAHDHQSSSSVYVCDSNDHLLGVLTVVDVVDAVLPHDPWPYLQGGLVTTAPLSPTAPTAPARSPGTPPTDTPPTERHPTGRHATDPQLP